jgi:hypothetical protein
MAAPLRAGTSSTRVETDEQKSLAIRVTSEQSAIFGDHRRLVYKPHHTAGR